MGSNGDVLASPPAIRLAAGAAVVDEASREALGWMTDDMGKAQDAKGMIAASASAGYR
jgi:hypothetical protein